MRDAAEPGRTESEAESERSAATIAPATPGAAPAQARVLALQRTAGNAAAARLAARAPAAGASRHGIARDAAALAPKPATTPVIPRAPAGRRLARGFWGKLWGGVKSVGSAIGKGVKTVAGAVKKAAVAVGGAVKDAVVATAGVVKDAAVAVGDAAKDAAIATASMLKNAAAWVGDAADWIWEGAKKAGSWAVDWLSKAGADVWNAIKWFGEHAWEVIKVIGIHLFARLASLGSFAWDFIHFLPFRLWNMIVQSWEGISRLFKWLYAGFDKGWSWDHVWAGFKGALWWTIDTLVRGLEVIGFTDALQAVWAMVFRTRSLTAEEIAESRKVHGKALIQYWQVRVDSGSYLVKLGKALNRITDKNAGERAVTTMHIIQAPSGMDMATTVHELTHVAQYERVGAIYMPQALHGQASEKGYDYGDLAARRAKGEHYRDLNREQQAQIAEDYYIVTELATTGDPTKDPKPHYSGTKATLQPFVDEMRRGEF